MQAEETFETFVRLLSNTAKYEEHTKIEWCQMNGVDSVQLWLKRD